MAMQVSIEAMIDLDDPPVEPPRGCAHPFMWTLARTLFEEHQRGPDGDCVSCPRWKICAGRSLAKDGLATALGQSVKESPYWVAYEELMSNPKAQRQSGGDQ